MDHLAFTLGGLTALGGSIGFFKTQSKPSLIGGVAIGSAYAVSGYYFRQAEVETGLAVALVTSTLLTFVGGRRTFATEFKKPVPLVLLTLGTIGLGYYTFKYKQFYL
ncbi:hypothetical protein ACO0SA_003080 [Hanseniaspora valbyensis]